MTKKYHYQKPQKKTNADNLLSFVDSKPIAGVGDSLIQLNFSLAAIDEATRLKCLQIALDEYKEFHDKGMQ